MNNHNRIKHRFRRNKEEKIEMCFNCNGTGNNGACGVGIFIDFVCCVCKGKGFVSEKAAKHLKVLESCVSKGGK
jgi:DnaJ-class molecular chaperone